MGITIIGMEQKNGYRYPGKILLNYDERAEGSNGEQIYGTNADFILARIWGSNL